MNEKVKRVSFSLLGAALLALFAALTIVAPQSNALVESNDGETLTGKPIEAGKSDDGIQRLLDAVGERAEISLNRATNVARFVRFTSSDTNNKALALGLGSPEAKANAFFQEYGDVFGIRDAGAELVHLDTKADLYGATRVAYEQLYQGVPVFGSQMYAHFDKRGELTAVNGTIVPDIAVNTRPTLSANKAAQTAIAEVTAQQENGLFSINLSAANNDLMVFRTGLLQGIDGLSYLAYRVEVADTAGSVREFVFVDAHNGKILDQITGIHDGLDRKIYLEAFDLTSLVWQEGDAYPYVGAEATGINRLIDYAEDSYDLFYNVSGGTYDSYDGQGATMHSVYNDPRINCPNANWNGVSTNYCTDVDGDDTVAHEWTHAYTDFTHDLIYQWQPGALNESYSDIFGEIVDMINGAGTDTPDVQRTADTCSVYTRVPIVVRVNEPMDIADDYSGNQASFGPTVDGTLTDASLMAADDGSAAPTEACNPLVNDLTGEIAFVRRGSCDFTVKVKNAQDAGAIGVVVANHESGGDNTFSMSGVDTSITIQSVMIGYSDGNAIEAELTNGVNADFIPDPSINTENSLRWLSGEDDPAFGGAIRDMWNPGCYGDPGEVIEENYMCGTADGGGVHTNSGVPNHAFALLVDGGTYNGVNVDQVGLTKTAAIYWHAMSIYQHPATDFADHADALATSCNDLVGENIYDPRTGAISSVQIGDADCDAVNDAMTAVEMSEDPTAQCAFTTLLEQNPPPVCDGIGNPVDIYTATFEADASDWSMSTDIAFPSVEPLMWGLTSTLPGGRAGSGFYAIDERGGSCNADADDDSRVLHLDSPVITVPGTATHARVSFWHYVATELDWDGGNVKISVNGGDWQIVEGRYYTYNAYNDTLSTVADGNTNPLAGEEAFTGSDGGNIEGSWGQSQVNVGRYAKPGDAIQLRFDFGSDGCSGLFGWYVDDVDVFYCDGQTDPDVTLFANGIEDYDTVNFMIDSSLSVATNPFEKHTLEIMNTGINDLVWIIQEENVTSSPSSVSDVRDSSRVNGLANADITANANAPYAAVADELAASSTIVTDGGFEAGDDMAYFGGGPANPHWNSYSTQPAGPICTNDMCGDNAFEGNNYLWIGLMDGEFGGGEVAGVTQTVTIPAGGYEFSMMLWNSENFSDQLTVTLDSTVIYSTTGGANFDDYYPIVVDITSFADENDHVLGIEASVFSRSYGFVLDSVAIEPVPCLALSDISWASALQTSGTMLRDTSLEVSVFFDATGLTPGVYNANLCVDTNAPSNPTVPVPLSLQVLYDVFLPIMTR